MRDHGGNLDWARARWGGAAGDWIDLSTGINARPYPVPKIPTRAWSALPTRSDTGALAEAAARAYGTGATAVPLAGAQAAIQIVPRLRPPGTARVLGPTYNEHAAALRAAGWQVEECGHAGALAGADLAVVVNPNNPDGRVHAPGDLLALARDTGLLVVDESFADPTPEVSVAPALGPDDDRLLVLRSFGKFYGLAGLRLGFAVTGTRLAERIAEAAGPWAASGPAISIGQAALGDTAWRRETSRRLAGEAARLDALAARAGWSLVGGTTLFRTYETGNAEATRSRLAEARIWTRSFPYSKGWLRLGLPGSDAVWTRLEKALAGERE